ncbi:MAG: hypothetical protein QM831_00705 [Kofleriaceae bacterium]
MRFAVLVVIAACGSNSSKPPDSKNDAARAVDAVPIGDAPPNPFAACKLAGPTNGVGLGFPRIAARAPSTGTVRVGVVFVDFSDAVASKTPQQAFSIISPGAEQFYAGVSYGKMTLAFDPYFAWLRMSKPTSGYNWGSLTFASHKAYIQEAIDLAGTNIDFSHDDAVLVISNPDSMAFANGPTLTANPGDGYTASGKTFNNAVTSGGDLEYWGSYWFNHEFGHAMALADLYDYDMPTNPPTLHYVGDYSIMGNIAGPGREYLGWERWLLGWLDDTQVTCAPMTGSTTAVLTPIEATSGAKMMVAPLDASSALVVELRTKTGYDTGLTSEGLLVYVVAPALGSGHGVVKVLPIDDSDLTKLGVLLQPTHALTYGGVTVTFSASDAAGAHVTISH